MYRMFQVCFQGVLGRVWRACPLPFPFLKDQIILYQRSALQIVERPPRVAFPNDQWTSHPLVPSSIKGPCMGEARKSRENHSVDHVTMKSTRCFLRSLFLNGDCSGWLRFEWRRSNQDRALITVMPSAGTALGSPTRMISHQFPAFCPADSFQKHEFSWFWFEKLWIFQVKRVESPLRADFDMSPNSQEQTIHNHPWLEQTTFVPKLPPVSSTSSLPICTMQIYTVYLIYRHVIWFCARCL